MSIVSGGSIQLNSNLISASHSTLDDSSIYFNIIQPPQNGIRIILKEDSPSLSSFSSLVNFTQKQINERSIWLEHTPINEKQSWDVIGLNLRIIGEDGKILDSGNYFLKEFLIKKFKNFFRPFPCINYQN